MDSKVLRSITVLFITLGLCVFGSEINVDQNNASTSTTKQQTSAENFNKHSSGIKKQKLPAAFNVVVDSNTFAKVVESSAFVDKTMFIKKFLLYYGSYVMLITCPRKFGKSSNLNMIKTFLEIVVDEKGNPVPVKCTQNYKLFMKPGDLSSLNIANEKDIIDNHLGQHPVILIDFSNVRRCNSDTYETITAQVKVSLHETFKQHTYLLKSSKIEKDQIEYFEKFVDNQRYTTLNVEDVLTGLVFLSDLLQKHFGKKSYILVDEYDAPVHYATLHGLDIDKVHSLIDEILVHAFKRNFHLEQGLITGVSAMMRASRSSALNTDEGLFHFLGDHKFVEYFGFTSYEVEKLLKDFAIEDVEIRKQVGSWYNGYFAESKNLHIYNPWSVIMYLKNSKFDSYWIQSGTINHVSRIFNAESVRDEIKRFVQNQELTSVALETDIGTGELKNLQRVLNISYEGEIDRWKYDFLYSYIFELGCLSYTNEEYLLKIPNEEISLAFKKVKSP